MCLSCAPAQLSRRRFLRGSGAAFCAAAAMTAAAPAWAASETAPSVTPDESLQQLVEGNARYASGGLTCHDYSARRAKLTASQHPFAAIVSCADSRVAPELAFDQGPGDLFIVRVAGNFVNDDGLASLEYGVKFLGVPYILVLGHTNCGAVDAAIKVVKDNAQLPGQLPALVNAIKPAVTEAMKESPNDLLAAATRENVRLNVQRLMDDKPVIAAAVAAGRCRVGGGVYDLATGKVVML